MSAMETKETNTFSDLLNEIENELNIFDIFKVTFNDERTEKIGGGYSIINNFLQEPNNRKTLDSTIQHYKTNKKYFVCDFSNIN
jgi:hypothetical protein